MRCTQRRHRRLVGEVETVQRLVEHQDPRAAHERLGDQDALLLAAGVAHRAGAARMRSRRPARSPPAHARPRACAARADASGNPQRHPSRPRRTRSTPRIGSRPVEAVTLGQVADLAVRGAGRAAQHADRCPAPAPAGRGAPAGASTCRCRSGRAPRRTRPRTTEIDAAPHLAPAHARVGVAQLDGRGRVVRARGSACP